MSKKKKFEHKKRKNVFAKLRRGRTKQGDDYFYGSFEGGANITLMKSFKLDENGCEVWELIIDDGFSLRI